MECVELSEMFFALSTQHSINGVKYFYFTFWTYIENMAFVVQWKSVVYFLKELESVSGDDTATARWWLWLV